MYNDPIVDEIHRIRAKMMARCGNDPKKFYAMVKKNAAKYKDRLVSLAPKRVTKRRKVA